MSKIEKQFQQHVLDNLIRAESQSGYDLTPLCKQIEKQGAVKIARMLVDPMEVDDPPGGFMILLGLGLERYSAEQAILDFADSGLFDEYEIATARERLTKFARTT